MAKAKSPTPKQVIARRLAAGLTQTEAGDLVHAAAVQVWQRWESGDRAMHPAFWELFRIKTEKMVKKAERTIKGVKA